MPNIYFNSQKLPRKWQNEYVAFLDVMGVQNRMKIACNEAANFIFKLHAAVISTLHERPYKNVFCYPLMDGIYITSTTKDNMSNILTKIYRELSKLLISEKENKHIFLVRSAIAYGPVIHGHDIPLSASKVFGMEIGYKEKILLGSTMIDAYKGESQAAPMGIYIDKSATKSSLDAKNQGAYDENWKWWNSNDLKLDDNIEEQMKAKLESYYKWLDTPDNKYAEGYNKEKRDKHIQKVREYFQR